MIYCEKIQDYINQDLDCVLCIFYKEIDDSCTYSTWYPGLKKGKDEYIA